VTEIAPHQARWRNPYFW